VKRLPFQLRLKRRRALALRIRLETVVNHELKSIRMALRSPINRVLQNCFFHAAGLTEESAASLCELLKLVSFPRGRALCLREGLGCTPHLRVIEGLFRDSDFNDRIRIQLRNSKYIARPEWVSKSAFLKPS